MNTDQVSYNAIGTAASPATLTSVYTGNRTILDSRYLQNINLIGSYLPLTNGATLQIQFEMSPDGTNWAVLPVVSNSATEIDVYTQGMAIVFPGTGSAAVASTAVPVSYQITCVAQKIRVSAKETGGTTPGTLWLNVMMANTP